MCLMLISNNDNNALYISLQPSTPNIDPTHDDEGTYHTYDKGPDVDHYDRATYSISIEN